MRQQILVVRAAHRLTTDLNPTTSFARGFPLAFVLLVVSGSLATICTKTLLQVGAPALARPFPLLFHLGSIGLYHAGRALNT